MVYKADGSSYLDVSDPGHHKFLKSDNMIVHVKLSPANMRRFPPMDSIISMMVMKDIY